MINSLLATSSHKVKTLDYNGIDKISEYKPLNSMLDGTGVLKNTDGKYYIAAMGVGYAPVNRNPFFYKYNPISNQIEEEYELPLDDIWALNDIYDTHRVPTIKSDSAGYIWMSCEKLFNAPSGSQHGSNLLLYRSTNPHSINGFDLINDIDGLYTYPKLWLDNNNIYLAGRNTEPIWEINISDDLGATFTSLPVYDSGVATQRAYFWEVPTFENKLCVVLNERDDVTENFTFVAYIESDDGITWRNYQNSWSRNVQTLGAITRTEMVANCKIYESNDYDVQAVYGDGGFVRGDRINIMINLGTKTGNSYPGKVNPETSYDVTRMYYYDGGWVYREVYMSAPYNGYMRFTNLFGYNIAGEADYLYYIDPNDSKNVYVLKTVNNWQTTTKKLIYRANGKDLFYGHAVWNPLTEKDHFIVLIDLIGGDYFDFNNYSNLIFIKK